MTQDERIGKGRVAEADDDAVWMQCEASSGGTSWVDPTGGFLERLFEAVEHGDTREAETLMDECGEACVQHINALGPEGDTLLHIACLYGHEGCARLLLDRGASADVRDEDYSTVLHDASASGNLDIVRLIADKQADLVHAEDSDGDRPLHNAARGGYVAIVQFLLLEGADPNAQNRRGETARATCGDDADAALLEALEIAEKHFNSAGEPPRVQTPDRQVG